MQIHLAEQSYTSYSGLNVGLYYITDLALLNLQLLDPLLYPTLNYNTPTIAAYTIL